MSARKLGTVAKAALLLVRGFGKGGQCHGRARQGVGIQIMRAFLLLLVIGTSSAAAETKIVVDGSDAKVAAGLASEAGAALTQKFPGPTSLQLERLSKGNIPKHEILCGFFNVKDASGGYAGLQPFFYDRTRKELTIFNPSELDDASYDLQRQNFNFVGCSIK